MSLSPVHVSSSPTVDVNVPRFNQAVVAAALAIAFLLDAPALVGAVAVVLVVSAVAPRWAPLSALYIRAIRPRRGGRAIRFEDARPPRFAQRLGAAFTTAASIALFSGAAVIGWTLALLVAALAFLAATARVCVGCVIYQRWVA